MAQKWKYEIKMDVKKSGKVAEFIETRTGRKYYIPEANLPDPEDMPLDDLVAAVKDNADDYDQDDPYIIPESLIKGAINDLRASEVVPESDSVIEGFDASTDVMLSTLKRIESKLDLILDRQSQSFSGLESKFTEVQESFVQREKEKVKAPPMGGFPTFRLPVKKG